jgi:hypothetical protein
MTFLIGSLVRLVALSLAAMIASIDATLRLFTPPYLRRVQQVSHPVSAFAPHQVWQAGAVRHPVRHAPRQIRRSMYWKT